MNHQRVGPKEKIKRGQIKLTEAVWDDFDNLSPFQSESPYESEPFCRAIDYEAGKPFRNSFKIDDNIGAPFQDNPL